MGFIAGARPPTVADPPETEHACTPTADRRRRRILLADDAPTSQRIVAVMLESGGHEVTTVDDGAAAVRQVEAAAERGRPYDLVLMDMNMPVMDGYAATRRLRRHDHGLPILALTGHVGDTHRAACLRAGCTDHLPKPFTRRQLLDAVSHHLPD